MFTEHDRRFSALTGLILFIPIFSVFAQQSNYSLRQLVDSAQHYYPQLLQKQALLNSAEAAVTDAKHLFLPTLKVNEQVGLGTDNSIPGSYITYGIIPSASSGVRKGNNSQSATENIAILAAQYDLIDFGYRHAFIESAKSFVNLFQADRERELYNLKIQASQLYFNLLKNQFRLLVNKQNVARYEEIFKVIKALTQSGIKPGSDSSLAKAELSKSRIIYNQTLGQISQVKEQLSFLSGIPAQNLQIDTATETFMRIRSDINSQTEDSIHNPFLDYYESQKNTFLAQEKLISKAYLPKIVLTANTWARGSSITYDDQYKALSEGLGYQRYNYLAGVSFQYDLFNGIHKHDKLRVYQFQTTASDLALQQEKLSLHSASLQAASAIQTAETNLLELPVQLSAARSVYDQELAQYKAGIINLVDLTNAAFVLDRSQNDFIETLADWYLAQLDKAWSGGTIDQFINTIK
ncbi:MAG: TolC family protein [Bacteroidota bacterium]|nr:TolC family protein [Bacteroidota bacterium]